MAISIVANVGDALAADPLPVPTPTSPAHGATVGEAPVFAWDPVVGIDHYDFQIAADAGFTTPVVGVSLAPPIRTRNTRATIDKTLANATYWWRVRSATATDVSAWSAAHSFVHSWNTSPALLAPVGGAEVVASKSGVLTSTGTFTTSFRRPASGMCKTTARYGGTSGDRPSQASATFRC
ncbi:MAG TPA: hypothetical protein VG144_00085 [Gaiellaceae bacterium]|nr:hypothetical protein [Gaiellaceae bacterium]